MSTTSESKSYRGRYSKPVPTSNLGAVDEDFPEFERFDDGDDAPVGGAPRGYPPPAGGFLSVQHVDMCQQVNKPKHFTGSYDINNLVVRRGQEFVVRVTFNRPLAPEDDFQLEFLIGSNPSPSKGSLVVVTFGTRPGGPWSGRIVESQGQAVILGVTPTPNAIVGKFRTYVAIVAGGGLQRTRRDPSTDLYLLFNAWCPEDAVFLPNDRERGEYVLNDIGVIYQGAVGSVSQRNWVFGQFERGILNACIHILDASQMPIYNRGDVVKLVRKGSAMLNSQDDNGVMVGNWSEDFSMGKSPTSWTGSVRILLQYVNTGVPVCFAQCWVFAGVFNTFLRCLGIPARVITNFSSAHDNTGNLKTDLIFKPDGTPDKRHTRDSIWNYHCWNEVFMTRYDLPPEFGGWQVVDATPQETSDGHFRCGPASVAAIKSGLLCHPFDSGFVFAEVNSDVVFITRDRYGSLTPFKVDKTHIGQMIYTKGIGTTSPVDITLTYKPPEGSAENNTVMSRAEEYGCERDHSQLPDATLTVDITTGQCMLGDDLTLAVDFQNHGGFPQTVLCHLSGSVVFYTGVTSTDFKNLNFSVTVPANQTERVNLKVTAQEYFPHLGSQICLSFILTANSNNQSVSAMKVVELQTPSLTMMVSGQPQVHRQMFVTVSFTNPFNFLLQDVSLAMEGPGLIEVRTRFYSVIEPQASISWTESFSPRLDGPRRIVAVMDSRNLRQVWGIADCIISP